MTYLRTLIRPRGVLALAALAAAASLPALQPADAVPSYDGLWSVVIVTEKGDCDRAYRYPIRITKGQLENAGSTSFVINGKVAANGAITVKISYGEKSASGSGRLSGMIGAGSWKGGNCAGTWEAERRG
jgi:hypothetical protein